MVGQEQAWRCRHGTDSLGESGSGAARHGRRGMQWWGLTEQGEAGRSIERRVPGMAGQVRQGDVWQGSTG
jgi:hypothetical protein